MDRGARSRKLSLLAVALAFLLLLSFFSPYPAGVNFLGHHSPRAKPAAAIPSRGQLPAKSPTLALPNATQQSPSYDEQLGLSFTQSFTSLAYNVTATVQQDSLGFGPAYLLNGVSNKGYWYQVGISWDWPFVSGGYSPGFGFNFETFSYNGSSIFPANSGGLDNFSGPVNPGDLIGLSLSFSGTNVSMQAVDWNTSSSAGEKFSSFGATSFVGSPSGISNSRGFFTGLMTEEYHARPYNGTEKKVVYENSLSQISSAWMWVDEFNSNTSQVVFYDSTPQPVLYARDPFQLHYFFSNGSIIASSAKQFVTGTFATVGLTLSFAVAGQYFGSSGPVLTYVSNGTSRNAVLGQYPSTFSLDMGSQWSVSAMLSRSPSYERWFTLNSTKGLATSNATLRYVFYLQYLEILSFSVSGGGSNFSNPEVDYTSAGSRSSTILSQDPVGIWVDAGSRWNATNPLAGSSENNRWLRNETFGIVNDSGTATLRYVHQTKVLTAFSVVNGGNNYSSPYIASRFLNATYNATLTTSPRAMWLDSGAPWVVSYLLPGSNATERWEALTFTGTVSGAKISPEYYHQKWVHFEYSIVGGGGGYTPPLVNVSAFGFRSAIAPNSSYWVDYSTPYSYPSILPGSNASERWIEIASSTGIILSEQSTFARYQTQYFVSIGEENNASGGVVSPSTGWYNATTRVSLSALNYPGWKFFGWQGGGVSSYSGNESSTTIVVNAPLREEAKFYPGVTISSGSGGSVSLDSPFATGKIASGASKTVFVPPNSEIFLSASPASLFQMFNGWNGSIDSGRQADTFLVNQPISLGASFGFNYVLVMIVAAGSVMVASAVIGVMLARRKNSMNI